MAGQTRRERGESAARFTASALFLAALSITGTVSWATPLPGPPPHPPSPEGGFGETSAGEGTHLYRGASPSHSLCAEKGVGPPDAVNTGGPVPLLEILAGKGGFAGQVRRRFRP